MKKSITKVLSLIMATAMILSVCTGIFPLSASALDLSKPYEVSWDNILTDADGNTFTWYGGVDSSSNIYGHSYANAAHSMHDYTVKRQGLTGTNANWTYNTDFVYAYCIDPGIPLPDNTSYTGNVNGQSGDKWSMMSANQHKLIQEALTYGYPNRMVQTSKDANACYAATQLIVWQIAFGWRTSPTSVNDQSYPMSGHSGTMTQQLCANPYFNAFYTAILSDMASYYIIPSFTNGTVAGAPTYELTQSGGQYKLTLNDTNGVLSNFDVTASGGVTANISGNTLTLTSSTPITSAVTVSLTKHFPVNGDTTGFLIWTVPGKARADQNMVTGVDSDPVPAYLNLKVSTGTLSIVKTTENNNGSVSGFQFEVRDSSNNLIGTYTTDSSGVITVPNLVAGIYSVKEVNLSTDFVTPTPNPKNVTITAGGTTSVSFDNIKKRGILTIRKTDANPTLGGYSLAGAQFEVRDQGGTLVDTITVGSDGTGQSKILPLGVYQISESKSPYGFVRDSSTHTATLSGVQGTDSIVYSPDTSIAEQPETGRINVVKSNANKMMGDYDLSGTVFEIRAATDIIRADGSYYAHQGDLVDTITTDASGKAQSKDLKLGNYVVTEKSAVYGYVRNTGSFQVSLTYGGQDVPVVYGTANVPEQPQTGIIRIHKQDANPNMGDYPLNGAVFEVRAAQDIKCLDGTVIYNKGDLVDTVTTNAAGEAQTKQLPLGAFIVSEKNSPYGFVLNTQTYNPVLSYAGQDVTVTYTDVTVPEQPQVGTITVTKYDITTSTRAQGDATLTGAVFEVYCAQDIKKLDGTIIYSKDQLVDTLNCGNVSSATTKELPLGSYYVKEKIPPKGYTLDTSTHPVTIEYQGQNVSVVRLNAEVDNKVIQGQIAIVKHTDLPDPDVTPPNPQVEEPLDGIQFQVFLKSAGSYDSALPTERALLTTNSDGYAISGLLPYGVYTVKELPDAQGRDIKMVDPFDVFISADGQIYRYILNDPTFTSLVKVVKVDSETGKQIPAAGISFKVWDVTKSAWVVQHVNYPTPEDLDVYQTAADGTLVMPEALPSGDYELFEQSSPWGYVLSKDPVKFTVNSNQQDPSLATVIMANAPQKGIIKVEKQGNMLTGVAVAETSFGKQYTPIFSLTGLQGATFEVRAAEDIYTPDGTLRYAKGTLVDTITTDQNGYAETKQLYLGHFTVTEVKAPTDFVLDKSPHDAFLTYAGQDVTVTSTQIGLGNTRQTVEIDLQKLMERPVNAPANFSAFHDVIFGLYANQDIKAADGTVVIAKDSLVSLIQIDSNGKGVVSGELPFADYYVKEVQTNIYYQLNSTQYPVAAVYAGQDIATTKVDVNNGGIALPNETKLGRLTITKTGEMLVGAVQSDDKDYTLYTPTYEVRNLPGVTFNIVADEDIYDVYGRLLTPKGTVVDTVTTGLDGTAVSKLLHLGRYILVETAVPYGTVPDSTPHSVILGFDGQVTDVIDKSVTINNERQKAEINITKTCEMPENAPDNYNPYSGVIFGLYAKDDVKTADGTIVIPAGSLMEFFTFSQDGKADIKTDLPFGHFYVQEFLATPGYALDSTKYDLTFDYNANAGKVVTLNVNGGNPVENKLQRGSLKVIKTFEGTTVPMANIPFTITGKTTVGTDVTINARTDENGEIVLNNLLVGDYTVQELDSSLTAGYVLSPAQNVTIAADQIAELTINNVLQRGSLRIIKTFEGRTIPIANVPFHITGKTTVGTDFDQTYYTDENGAINIDGLLVGDYKIQELNTDLTLGYALSAEESAVVAPDQITALTINDKLQRGDLKIIKTFESKDVPIAGVPFTIEGTSLVGMAYSETFTTDANGEISITGLPIGQYTVKELDTDLTAGYVLSATQTAVIATDQLTTLEIGNKLQRGNLKIYKSFEDHQPMANVPFLIEGTSTAGIPFSETLYTNADGVILVEGLPVGDYTIKELASDLTKGYVLSPEQTVTVTADQTAETQIQDKLEHGSLKLIKTFEGKDTPIANVPFHITGKTTVGDNYDETFYTDANGVIQIDNLEVGDYTVEELASPLTVGYVLSQPQTFTITPDQITSMTIGNKLIRGNVTLTKTDANYPDHKLSGAVFEIYADTNGNKVFDKGDALVGAMTEKDGGVYEMLNLQYGGYFAVEKQAPAGFIKDDKAYYFAITADGQTVTVSNDAGTGCFIDQSQTGSLHIIKTSSDGKKEGFTFKVEGEGYSQTFVTDKNGEILITGLRVGQYTVTEVATDASKGYKLPDAVTVGIVADQTLDVNVYNDKITTSTPGGAPQTGDNSNMALWLTIMGVSAGALIVLIAAGKKKNRKQTSK